ncbi:MAG: hypothetical protein ACRCXM_09550 [Beijerinckiaceae bacterium]
MATPGFFFGCTQILNEDFADAAMVASIAPAWRNSGYHLQCVPDFKDLSAIDFLLAFRRGKWISGAMRVCVRRIAPVTHEA